MTILPKPRLSSKPTMTPPAQHYLGCYPIWEIYTKYIFLMFYWPEERNELALGTIRYSHHTFPSTAGIGVIECEDIKDHS